MEDKFIDLPLTEDETGSLGLHLRFIIRKDVSEILKEMKLTNDVDLSIVRRIADRLNAIAAEQSIERAVSMARDNDGKWDEILSRVKGNGSL